MFGIGIRDPSKLITALTLLVISQMFPIALRAQPTEPQRHDIIRLASENWTDYAEASVAQTKEPAWMGERIQRASLNWADYAETPIVRSP